MWAERGFGSQELGFLKISVDCRFAVWIWTLTYILFINMPINNNKYQILESTAFVL